MKRIALVAISTLAALIALFSYPTSTGQSGSGAAEPVSAAKVITQLGTSATTTGQGPDPATSAAGTGRRTAAPTTAAPAPAATSAAATSATVDGAAERTQFGVVQVEVVITGGKITAVTALKSPQTDRQSIQISSMAIPMLKAQVLKAQSAKIAGVSGATFTSDGYITSLQSALDAAGFRQ